MRGATQCARRLKSLIRSLRAKLGKVSRPTVGDPIKQMILGIFSRDVPESKAREAFDRLRSVVVDYNELRVIPAIEMTEMVGALPEARLKCEDLSRALNKIFNSEHEVSLDRLGTLSKKEVVAYLGAIDGLDPYSRARVRLLGLQQHAVPLSEAAWAYARQAQIVDKKCALEDAQAFLERRIPEGSALEFVALIEKQAWAEVGAAVRSGEVEHITSVPPDRTARNMLQLVAAGRAAGATAVQPKGAATDGADKPASRGDRSSRLAGKPKKGKRTATRSRKKAKPRRSARKAKPRITTKRRSGPKPRKAAKRKRKSKPAKSRKTLTRKTVRHKTSRRARRAAPRAKSA